MSLDQYHTEEEIYQMSLQREPRKPAVSCTLAYTLGPVVLSNISSLAVTLLFFCLHMMDGLDIHCTLHHISWNCQPLREFTFLRCSAQFFRYSFIFKESNYVHRNTALYWPLWSKVLNTCWKSWISMEQLPCFCNMTASASLGWYWHRALLLFGNTL